MFLKWHKCLVIKKLFFNTAINFTRYSNIIMYMYIILNDVYLYALYNHPILSDIKPWEVWFDSAVLHTSNHV